MEFDRDKLPASIDVAEKAIHQRLRGLPIAHSQEHRELRDALNSLAVLPLLFLAIIVFVAVRFGSTAGILGTIGAAAVFAEFLFEPTSSWRVDDSVPKKQSDLDGHHWNCGI